MKRDGPLLSWSWRPPSPGIPNLLTERVMGRPRRAVPTSIARRVFSLPTLVSLALAAAFLAFLVTRFDVDLAATWQQVKSANPLYLALALAIHYTTFLFRGARWRLLLRNVQGSDEASPTVAHCSQLVLLGWFANSVAWLRLGDAYRAYLYHEERRASFPRTMGTILSERLLDVAVIGLLLAVSLPFLLGRGLGREAGLVSAAVLTLLALLGLSLLALAGLGCIRERLPARLPAWVTTQFLRFRDGALGSLRQAPLAALWGLLAWLAEVGRLYLVTQALGIDLPPALIVFATLANSVLTLVPTPGGLGAVESGVAGLLKQLGGIATPAALSITLVDRSISYLSVIAAGTILFLARSAWRRKAGPATAAGAGLEAKGGGEGR